MFIYAQNNFFAQFQGGDQNAISQYVTFRLKPNEDWRGVMTVLKQPWRNQTPAFTLMFSLMFPTPDDQIDEGFLDPEHTMVSFTSKTKESFQDSLEDLIEIMNAYIENGTTTKGVEVHDDVGEELISTLISGIGQPQFADMQTNLSATLATETKTP